jgi:hypothetical protein
VTTAREAPELPGLTYLQHLGSGGYAEVFLYEQHMPKLKVAVKVLNADGIDAVVQAQFSAEADTMAQLSDHPFIVPVMRADMTEDGRPYIVMKYFPNPNLGVRARRELFSIADVLKIGVQISSAVETAHRAGILHRDIKPANILTGPYGDPGLTDFGIAATTAGDGVRAEGMSIPWSPPEILFGVSDGDVRSDVYSLGATFWHLLSGRSPFEIPGGDNSTMPLMRRIQADPVPAVRREDIPESLQRLIKQTLAKSPDGRPQTVLALARGLQAVEQELRLARTQIVVPEDTGTSHPPVVFFGEDDERTAVKAARVIPAQPEDAPTTGRAEPDPVVMFLPPAEEVAEEERPTTARATVVPAQGNSAPPPAVRTRVMPASELAPDKTISRVSRPTEPTPSETSVDTPPTEEVPSGRTRLVAAGLAGVIALVGGGIALAASASSGTHKTGTNRPDVTEQQDARDTTVTSTPDTPTVIAVSTGPGRGEFRLSYDLKAPGDFFFAVVRGGSPFRMTTPVLRYVLPPGQPVPCDQFRVVRARGGSSALSASVCGR